MLQCTEVFENSCIIFFFSIILSLALQWLCTVREKMGRLPQYARLHDIFDDVASPELFMRSNSWIDCSLYGWCMCLSNNISSAYIHVWAQQCVKHVCFCPSDCLMLADIMRNGRRSIIFQGEGGFMHCARLKHLALCKATKPRESTEKSGHASKSWKKNTRSLNRI